jgi:hypothetical protein
LKRLKGISFRGSALLNGVWVMGRWGGQRSERLADETIQVNLALVNPAKLAAKITDRHKVEREAFEKFAAVYGDEDGEAYKPSPGLLLWCARRRQLLDGEGTLILTS